LQVTHSLTLRVLKGGAAICRRSCWRGSPRAILHPEVQLSVGSLRDSPMPLTLEELQEIQVRPRTHAATRIGTRPTARALISQADAMADDIEIDFEKMSLWSKGARAMLPSSRRRAAR